jgi:Ca2+-binding RTX toxin-like protein
MTLTINFYDGNGNLFRPQSSLDTSKFKNSAIENKQVKDNLAVAKSIWENRLDAKGTVDVKIQVLFGDLTKTPTIYNLGETSPVEYSITYAQFQQKLLEVAQTSNDAVALAALRKIKSYDVLEFTAPNNFSEKTLNLATVKITKANAKALGLNITGIGVGFDATIVMNDSLPAGLSWDYTLSDDKNSPFNQSKKDFVGSFAHEVGHALGFASNSKAFGINNQPISPPPIPLILDLFKFSPGKNLTPNIVDYDVRNPGRGIQKIFSIDGGTTPEEKFGDGTIGDPDHWLGPVRNKRRISPGLMDPFTLPRTDPLADVNRNDLTMATNPIPGRVVPGQFDRIKKLDLIAFDVMGYNPKQSGVISKAAGKPKPPAKIGTTLDKIAVKGYKGTEFDDILGIEQANSTTVSGLGGYDSITGTPLKDTFYGGNEDDTLYGYGGGDLLFGEAGDDSIEGGIGNDSLYGGLGEDFIDGGDGDETEIQGNEGNDVLFGGNGNDKILGGADDDNIFGEAGNDDLSGGDGEDFLYGDDGNDKLAGGEGNDLLDGGAGADTLSGNNGDDVYIIDNIGDSIIGETATSGLDGVESSVSINLPNEIEDLTLVGTGNITGGGNSSDNILLGNDQKNILNGLNGDDIIYGAGGDDTLKGGLGNDYLDGSIDPTSVTNKTDGNIPPAVTDSGIDRLEGGSGNDTYFITAGDLVIENIGEGTDTVIAGASYVMPANIENLELTDNGVINDAVIDRPIGFASRSGTFMDNLLDRAQTSLSSGNPELKSASSETETIAENPDASNINATGNSLSNSIVGSSGRNQLLGLEGDDNLDGGGGNDLIEGDSGNDTLGGGAGNDEISGGRGQDSLKGGTGDDGLEGNRGDDRLFGGAGEDSLDGGQGQDILDGEDGDDLLEGGKGADRLSGANGNDSLRGGHGADYLNGGDGEDLLEGESGSDNLEGGLGYDQIYGGQGDDQLLGNNGDDYLNGNSGNDYLIGGEGADTVFGGRGLDVLLAGGGDHLTGGRDSDLFIISIFSPTVNIVNDFQLSEDRFSLESFNPSQGQLKISQQESDTLITVEGRQVALLVDVNAQSFSQGTGLWGTD